MKSGDGVTCAQYPFFPRSVTCARTRRVNSCHRGCPCVVRLGDGGLLERVERCLRVDDDVLVARKVDDDVGADTLVRDLAGVVDPDAHPREVEDPFELDLAPTTPALGAPESVGQRVRPGGQHVDLLREAATVLPATGLGDVDQALQIGQPLAHGEQRLLDALTRLVEKRRSRCCEGLGGDRLDGLGQLFLEDCGAGVRSREAFARGRSIGVRRREIDVQRVDGAAEIAALGKRGSHENPGAERPECDTSQECEDREHGGCHGRRRVGRQPTGATATLSGRDVSTKGTEAPRPGAEEALRPADDREEQQPQPADRARGDRCRRGGDRRGRRADRRWRLGQRPRPGAHRDDGGGGLHVAGREHARRTSRPTTPTSRPRTR